MLVKTTFSKNYQFFSPKRNRHLASRIVPNFRARIWQNSRFVWVLEALPGGTLTGFSFLSFQSRRFGVDIDFFLKMGMQIQIHISPLPAFHIEEQIIFSLLTSPHPTPLLHVFSEETLPDICAARQHVAEEVQRNVNMPPHTRSKTTRHLCSVATCSGRSTRNVNMPPPPHPLMYTAKQHY